jgi:hypothetical protein
MSLVGFVQATHAKHQAGTRTREAIALKLTSQGEAMLAGVQAIDDVRAIQQILGTALIPVRLCVDCATREVEPIVGVRQRRIWTYYCA